MGGGVIVVLLLYAQVLVVQSQVNVSVVLFASDAVSKEATRFAATQLNELDDANIAVDFRDAVVSDCHIIIKSGSDDPLHLILDHTQQNLPNEAVINLRIPTVSTVFGHTNILEKMGNVDPENEFFKRIIHPAEMLQDVILQIIEYLQINNILIIYKSGNQFLGDLHPKLLLKDISALFIEDEPQFIQKATAAQLLNYNHIFFIGEYAKISKYVKKRHAQFWYVITNTKPDEEPIDCDLFIHPEFDTPLNPTIAENGQFNDDLFYRFFVDVGMTAMLAARDFVEADAWDTGPADCTRPAHYKRGMVMLEKFWKPSTSVYAALHLNKMGGYYDFKMVFESRSPELVKMGHWISGNESKIVIANKGHWDRFRSVKNNYKILALVKPPFIYQDPNSPKKLFGYCIDMIAELSRLLDFTYELVPTDNIVDMLANYTEYDIALGAFRATTFLDQYLDFTIAFYRPVGIGILLKRPLNSSVFKFITVMESTVWFCVIGAFFINSIMIWGFERFSPYSYRNNKEKFVEEEDNRDFSFKECLWFCIMSITPQGGGDVPKHFSGRMAVVTWWIFGFIVLSSYTANLAAFLTLSKLKSPVESFDDLVKQYMIQYAPLNNSDEYDFFQKMVKIEQKLETHWRQMGGDHKLKHLTPWEYPLQMVYKKMLRNMENATLPHTFAEAVQRIQSSPSAVQGFALLGEISDLRYLAMTNCDILVVDDELSKIPYALGVRKGSMLKDRLSRGISDMIVNRRFDHFETKWWDENPDKADNCTIPEDHWQGVGMQNIGGVFLIIFVGIGITSLTICYELFLYNKRQKEGGKVVKIDAAKDEVGAVKDSGVPRTAASTAEARDRF